MYSFTTHGPDVSDHILVPMDDSDHAGDALRYAFETHPTATITVLHVAGAPSMLMGEAVGLAFESDLDAAAAEHAAPVFERATAIADAHDREIETVVGLGHPAREILDRAESCDAVVIGAHGADFDRALRRYLVGNVAKTVSTRASVPVTIVR